MRSYDEVKADIEALQQQEREMIFGAVRSGRSVDDRSVAPLAAEWARASRMRLRRTFGRIVAPLVAVTLLLEVAFFMRTVPTFGFAGAVTVAALASAFIGLIIWAVGLRPFVRAEQANLAATGAAKPPRSREPSHWVLAWLIGWPFAALAGLLIRAAGSDALAGPVGIVVWIAILYAIKRALDRRRAS